MQRLGIRPIVGLVHHGSGPSDTSLLDPEFPDKLAAHALRVAQRYPWVKDYTPVNEPQTTARFSCLYEFWYPHHRSMRSYVRALVNQIKAIVLAMRAVRTVQPEARLIHTDDGGATFAAPSLERYRLEREHRRWLGADLLCGRVTRAHPLFRFLLENGITEAEVLWFEQNPCPPAVLGLNYYVTSDRYLDDRLHLYAPFHPGGDTGDEPLCDVEAVRVRPEGITGACRMLREAWQRYKLPVAITEAHLGGPPDDQIRWLAEVWKGAQHARQVGADVRAVTVWALLGSWDWCKLCTENCGIYEPGVFHVNGSGPEPTPLTRFVRDLARGDFEGHPALAEAGWWRRPDRIKY